MSHYVITCIYSHKWEHFYSILTLTFTYNLWTWHLNSPRQDHNEQVTGCDKHWAIAYIMLCICTAFAFSALMLLVGWQGIRFVKNWVVGCWRGYLSGAKCRLTYGPADATAPHCLFASVKSRLVLPFWYWLTPVVTKKGPLNVCVCACVCVCICSACASCPILCLQCFDAVGWAAGRASGL